MNEIKPGNKISTAWKLVLCFEFNLNDSLISLRPVINLYIVDRLFGSYNYHLKTSITNPSISFILVVIGFFIPLQNIDYLDTVNI